MARTARTNRNPQPALTSTLCAAQQVRKTGALPATDLSGGHAVIAAMASSLQLDEVTRVGQLLGRDGLTGDTAPLLWENTRGGTFEEVLAGWEQQVRSERTSMPDSDRVTDWTQLRVDRRDRAIYRVGGPGAPFTEHALQQLIGAITAGGTGFRSAASALGWASPAAAAQLLVELMAQSKRDRTSPLVVRTGFRLRQGPRAEGSPVRERVIRAILTARASGVHYDDPALMAVLASVTPAGNRAHVARSALGTETRGWVEVTDKTAPKTGLDLMVSFRGSETGEARLGFRSSCRIRFLDVVMVAHRGVAVADEQEIEVGTARGASERNHTLPTISSKELRETYNLGPGTNGTRLTEPQRASIAAQRMTASFTQASAAAFELGRQWAGALKTFAPGAGPLDASGGTAEVMAQVLLDLCEEHGMVLGADRAGIEQVLIDDSRLMSLPHGSAAHMAAAFAVLAARGTATVSEVGGKKVTTFQPLTWREAQRLQEVAGRWVACGWDRKAHRAAMQESGED